jgi:hypothetical protein
MALYRLGWVAGFIYSDGKEWLFSRKDWENSSPFASASQKAVVHKTKEKAIAHIKLLRSWNRVNPTDKCFVREWALETNKEMDLPTLEHPHGEMQFVD